MFPTLYKPLKYYLQKFCKRFRRCKLYNILEKTLERIQNINRCQQLESLMSFFQNMLHRMLQIQYKSWDNINGINAKIIHPERLTSQLNSSTDTCPPILQFQCQYLQKLCYQQQLPNKKKATLDNYNVEQTLILVNIQAHSKGLSGGKYFPN